MEKRTREILALVLLAALLVVGSAVIVWYILVGHGWNMAASHIDDLVGSMEGYTVVVFEGTETPPVESRDRAASEPALFGAESAVAAAVRADAEAQAAQAAEIAKALAKAQSESGQDPSMSDITVNPSLSPRSSQASSQAADKAVSDMRPIVDEMAEPVDIDKVCQNYLEKGAAVIKVRSGDLAYYEDPIVVSKRGTRYGIFYAPGHYRYSLVRSTVKELRAKDVGFIIAVTADDGLAEGPLNGVDLAIFACNAGIPTGGEWDNGTFCVDAPYLGEVQAVIMAPSGVMTSKSISSL